MLTRFLAIFGISRHYQVSSLCPVITYNFSLIFKAWCNFLGLYLELLDILSIPVEIQPDIPKAMRLVVSL